MILKCSVFMMETILYGYKAFVCLLFQKQLLLNKSGYELKLVLFLRPYTIMQDLAMRKFHIYDPQNKENYYVTQAPHGSKRVLWKS
jgi:hypothetical protein